MGCEGVPPRGSGCQAGASALQAYCIETFPPLSNLGCFNPSSNMSGGGPSWHTAGAAIDLGCNWYDVNARGAGDSCFAWLLSQVPELELQQVIWADRIWDCSYGAVRHYSGTDHHNHLHVALGAHAAAHWTRPSAPPAPEPIEELEAMAIVIYKGEPHSFYVDDEGWLQHSWGRGARENMNRYIAGEKYDDRPGAVSAAVNGDWLNVRTICTVPETPQGGRRMMCFEFHPASGWSSSYVTGPA